MKNNTIKIILLTLMIIFTIYNATALTWTQYTPSPTTDAILKIRTVGSYAMAKDTSLRILYFNSTNWNEINKPLGETATTLTFEKASNHKFYWTFGNTTKQSIWEYNPATTTWTHQINITPTSSYTFRTFDNQNIACKTEGTEYTGITNDAVCYIEETNATTVKAQAIMDAPLDIPPIILTATPPIYSGSRIGIASGGASLTATNSNFYEWNAVSNVLQDTFGFNSQITDWDRLSASNKIITGTAGATFIIKRYNTTTGTFQTRTTSGTPFNNAKLHPSNNNIYYISGVNVISLGYAIGSTTTELTASQVLNTIDDDWTTENFWTAGNNGVLYYANLPTPPVNATSNYSITTTINTNPAIYGSNVQFTTTLRDDSLGVSNTTRRIYNATGSLIMTFTSGTNDPTGTTYVSLINGANWQNFQIGQTYYFNSTATKGATTITNSLIWSVVGNATINTTNYNLTSYQTTINNYTNINAIDNYGNNDVFATGETGTTNKIISYDITNPNSIIIKDKTITPNPTTISTGSSDKTYLGTDNGVYIYNGTSNTDATLLIENPQISFSFGNQNTQDTDAIDDTYAWACRQGYFTDDLNLINTTSNSISQVISTSPCLSIQIKNDVIYVHQGINGIKIYNTTTSSQIGSISAFASMGSITTHDRLSIIGNTLFAITGTTQISKYDITTPTSPIRIADCYTTNEVVSLEAIDANQSLVGTQSGIRICDVSNSALYEPISQKYTTINLKTYLFSEIPYEIINIDNNGKFAVAEGNRIGIYYYNKAITQTTTNQAPIIDDISTTTNTICINSNLPVTIIAHDPDTAQNLLSYDLDCEGTQAVQQNDYLNNQFSCSYATAGSKLIKAWVRDNTIGGVSIMATKTITVTTGTCNFLQFKLQDSITGELLQDVLINVAGQGSQLTNSAGQAYFNLTTSGNFTVSFTKSGYVSRLNEQVESGNTEYVVLLEPNSVGGVTRSQLVITVIDQNNNVVPFALVTATDPITTIAKTAQANLQGIATLFDLPYNLQLKVSAGATGYTPTFANTYINTGQTKTLTIQIVLIGQSLNTTSNRGCVDDINGVFLCSPLRFDGNGNNCVNDSECISGRCSLGSTRTCSQFNWTYCDARGMARGNKCYLSAITKAEFASLGNVILKNFLYVLIFIFIIIMIAYVVMLMPSRRN